MKFYKLEDGSGRYLGVSDNLKDTLIEKIPELIAEGLIDTSYEKTYSQTEFELVTNPPTPTWENTLSCHQERSSTEALMVTASALGYTYFTWNERIYKVTNLRSDGLDYSLVEDIYELDIK